jgi:hypothetical protein
MPLSPDGAAQIWRAVTAELRKPGAEQQVKMARNAMAQDTSTDHIESKKLIGSVAWGIVQDTAELKAACDGIDNLDDFIKALAENFLKEPALGARAETYEALGLPPPDESGAPHSRRKPPSTIPSGCVCSLANACTRTRMCRPMLRCPTCRRFCHVTDGGRQVGLWACWFVFRIDLLLETPGRPRKDSIPT